MRIHLWYAWGQFRWLCRMFMILAFHGLGVRWICLAIRVVIYGLVILPWTFPVCVWYVCTPTLLRRVTYRASRKEREEVRRHLKQTWGKRSDDDSVPTINKERAKKSRKQGADDELEDNPNRPNRNNRAKMDIYFPVELEHLFCQLGEDSAVLLNADPFFGNLASGVDDTTTTGGSETKSSPINDDDNDSFGGDEDELEDALFYQLPSKRRRFPIVILVVGGAWIIGTHFWGSFLAKIIAKKCGCIVCCPDYRNFPQATFPEMITDVDDAVQFVMKNAERFHGDAANITLLGQSAGAHLAIMSILRQSALCCDAEASTPATASESSIEKSPLLQAMKAKKVVTPKYNPQRLRSFIGVSGIYDIVAIEPLLHRRGLYSAVVRHMTGFVNHLKRSKRDNCPPMPLKQYYSLLSPTRIVHDHWRSFQHNEPADVGDNKKQSIDSSITKCAKKNMKLPSSILFIHGDKDHSAPVEESFKLAQELNRVVALNCEENKTRESEVRMIILRDGTHTDPIVEEPLLGVSSIATYLQSLHNSCGSELESRGSGTQQDGGRIKCSGNGSGATSPLSIEFKDLEVARELMPRLMRFGHYLCPF